MSAILEFYIWFRFWPYHRRRLVILHQSAKFLSISDHPQQKKMTSRRFSKRRISAILDFRGPIMSCLKTPCTNSYRSPIYIIAVNCLVFEKIAFFSFWRQTDDQMDSTDALSHFRCREQRLNNVKNLYVIRMLNSFSIQCCCICENNAVLSVVASSILVFAARCDA